MRIARLGIVALLLTGCTKQSPLYCDESTDCSHQFVKTFCDIDAVNTELQNECSEPPAPNACNRATPCLDAAKPECSDDSIGTCVECTRSEHCDGDAECDEDNRCVDVLRCSPGSSGDAVCAAENSELPYCSATDTCGECADSSHCLAVEASVCGDDFGCRGCEANGECESSVCQSDDGTCVPEAEVVYVTSSGADAGDCDREAPCATIAFALGKVDATRATLLIGAGNYPESITITDTDLRIIAEGGATMDPFLQTGTAVMTLTGSSNVSIEGLTLLPTSGDPASDAIRCTGSSASLVFRDGTVRGARDVGFLMNDCALELRRSVVANNDGAGIVISNAGFIITNNFIVFNGDSGSLQGGVHLGSTIQPQIFDFNTVFGNTSGGATGSFECSTIPPMTARNNIIYQSTGGTPTSGNCLFEYSNVQGGAVGTGNIDQDPKVQIGTAIGGDFHLKSDSPCIDAADPATDISIDIDGEVRPQGLGHDMGADEAG